MILLRKSRARSHSISGGKETWESFPADLSPTAGPGGFRSLQCFREEGLTPGAGFEIRIPRDLEIVTYVPEGSVTLEDPGGRTVLLEGGECRRSAARKGSLHRAVNGSLTNPVRVFQCLMTPDLTKPQTAPDQKRFPIAERKGILRLLASPNGQDASLQLRQDAGLYSSILDPGHHLIHELAPRRAAWLHVVRGRIQLEDQILEWGDGASLIDEAAVSLTAREGSEILLFDMI